MNVYKYDTVDETSGYSINDVFWVSPTDSSNCSEVAALWCKDDEKNKPECYTQAMCTNRELRRSQYQSKSYNGRYIDSKNAYSYEIIRTANLGIGCIGLIALCAYTIY